MSLAPLRTNVALEYRTWQSLRRQLRQGLHQELRRRTSFTGASIATTEREPSEPCSLSKNRAKFLLCPWRHKAKSLEKWRSRDRSNRGKFLIRDDHSIADRDISAGFEAPTGALPIGLTGWNYFKMAITSDHRRVPVDTITMYSTLLLVITRTGRSRRNQGNRRA